MLSAMNSSSQNSANLLIAKVQQFFSRDLALENDYLRQENKILRSPYQKTRPRPGQALSTVVSSREASVQTTAYRISGPEEDCPLTFQALLTIQGGHHLCGATLSVQFSFAYELRQLNLLSQIF